MVRLLSAPGHWEWYRRLARHGYRQFSQTLHLSLAVLLVGGGVLFEYSYNAVWHARNKGVGAGAAAGVRLLHCYFGSDMLCQVCGWAQYQKQMINARVAMPLWIGQPFA